MRHERFVRSRRISRRRAPPLADRLRPKTLAEVVGQDHIIGPEGPIGRMIATGRPHSIVPVGSARHRQDHHRAAALDSVQAAFRAIVGGVLRRRRPQEDFRAAARQRRKMGQGHAALHRRDPPLQPQPAGFLPARGGGRHRRPRWGYDRKPLLRAQRRAPLPRPGPRPAPARRRGAGGTAQAGRSPLRRKAEADRRCPRQPARHGRWRRPAIS